MVRDGHIIDSRWELQCFSFDPGPVANDPFFFPVSILSCFINSHLCRERFAIAQCAELQSPTGEVGGFLDGLPHFDCDAEKVEHWISGIFVICSSNIIDSRRKFPGFSFDPGPVTNDPFFLFISILSCLIDKHLC